MANLGYIQLTRECNQKCLFCSNPPTQKEQRHFEDIKRIIDEFIERQYTGVIITGGEPTLSDNLVKTIGYCRQHGFPARLITNGQCLADKHYLTQLKEAGLRMVHLSLYSHREQTQNYLTQKKDSWSCLRQALNNLAVMTTIHTNINTVINKYNADHLSDLAQWVVTNYSFIKHFVFNNLDPLMNRAAKNKHTIPRLVDFEVELSKAMNFLHHNQKTFRVERVPLCYMGLFPHCSTETRKIVKSEERIVYFLDDKKKIRQHLRQHWYYGKARACSFCSVNDICAGLYQMDKYYFSRELYPLFANKSEIKDKIVLSN
jgi:MoaA/NifB/PqqE/SkfB family radical SAM enzyme